MNVFVSTLTGQSKMVAVGKEASLAELKSKVAETFHFATSESVVLLLNGRALPGDYASERRPLRSFCIEDYSSVTAMKQKGPALSLVEEEILDSAKKGDWRTALERLGELREKRGGGGLVGIRKLELGGTGISALYTCIAENNNNNLGVEVNNNKINNNGRQKEEEEKSDDDEGHSSVYGSLSASSSASTLANNSPRKEKSNNNNNIRNNKNSNSTGSLSDSFLDDENDDEIANGSRFNKKRLTESSIGSSQCFANPYGRFALTSPSTSSSSSSTSAFLPPPPSAGTSATISTALAIASSIIGSSSSSTSVEKVAWFSGPAHLSVPCLAGWAVNAAIKAGQEETAQKIIYAYRPEVFSAGADYNQPGPFSGVITFAPQSLLSQALKDGMPIRESDVYEAAYTPEVLSMLLLALPRTRRWTVVRGLAGQPEFMSWANNHDGQSFEDYCRKSLTRLGWQRERVLWAAVMKTRNGGRLRTATDIFGDNDELGHVEEEMEKKCSFAKLTPKLLRRILLLACPVCLDKMQEAAATNAPIAISPIMSPASEASISLFDPSSAMTDVVECDGNGDLDPSRDLPCRSRSASRSERPKLEIPFENETLSSHHHQQPSAKMVSLNGATVKTLNEPASGETPASTSSSSVVSPSFFPPPSPGFVAGATTATKLTSPKNAVSAGVSPFLGPVPETGVASSPSSSSSPAAVCSVLPSNNSNNNNNNSSSTTLLDPPHHQPRSRTDSLGSLFSCSAATNYSSAASRLSPKHCPLFLGQDGGSAKKSASLQSALTHGMTWFGTPCSGGVAAPVETLFGGRSRSDSTCSAGSMGGGAYRLSPSGSSLPMDWFIQTESMHGTVAGMGADVGTAGVIGCMVSRESGSSSNTGDFKPGFGRGHCSDDPERRRQIREVRRLLVELLEAKPAEHAGLSPRGPDDEDGSPVQDVQWEDDEDDEDGYRKNSIIRRRLSRKSLESENGINLSSIAAGAQPFSLAFEEAFGGCDYAAAPSRAKLLSSSEGSLLSKNNVEDEVSSCRSVDGSESSTVAGNDHAAAAATASDSNNNNNNNLPLPKDQLARFVVENLDDSHDSSNDSGATSVRDCATPRASPVAAAAAAMGVSLAF